jgi:hypothetical protein
VGKLSLNQHMLKEDAHKKAVSLAAQRRELFGAELWRERASG